MGDSIFLKMQPYIQSSIAPRANHKLAFKYFGPFPITEKVPARVLDRRLVQRGNKSIAQVLVKWGRSPESMATWEDQETLKQNFPRAPAWGQAASVPGGIVSDSAATARTSHDPLQGEPASNVKARPMRVQKRPARSFGPEWV